MTIRGLRNGMIYLTVPCPEIRVSPSAYEDHALKNQIAQATNPRDLYLDFHPGEGSLKTHQLISPVLGCKWRQALQIDRIT